MMANKNLQYAFECLLAALKETDAVKRDNHIENAKAYQQLAFEQLQTNTGCKNVYPAINC